MIWGHFYEWNMTTLVQDISESIDYSLYIMLKFEYQFIIHTTKDMKNELFVYTKPFMQMFYWISKQCFSTFVSHL